VRGSIIERGREFYSLEQAVLEGREGEKERRERETGKYCAKLDIEESEKRPI
jgi:hypothetical protein